MMPKVADGRTATEALLLFLQICLFIGKKIEYSPFKSNAECCIIKAYLKGGQGA